MLVLERRAGRAELGRQAQPRPGCADLGEARAQRPWLLQSLRHPDLRRHRQRPRFAKARGFDRLGPGICPLRRATARSTTPDLRRPWPLVASEDLGCRDCHVPTSWAIRPSCCRVTSIERRDETTSHRADSRISAILVCVEFERLRDAGRGDHRHHRRPVRRRAGGQVVRHGRIQLAARLDHARMPMACHRSGCRSRAIRSKTASSSTTISESVGRTDLSGVRREEEQRSLSDIESSSCALRSRDRP